MDTSKTWFAEWFDTDYYHILYQNRDDHEAQQFIERLIEFLKIPENSNCLDLACGKGRHAKFLSEHGLNVTGLDLSENSIQFAKQFEHNQLHFDVHDMRMLYSVKKFDYIFNLFTSFGYFETNKDNVKVLQAVEDMLHPGGMAIIDFMNAEKVIDNLVSAEQKTLSDITFNITRNYTGTHILKDIHFSDKGEEFHYTERVQALKKDDFMTMLKETSLEIEEIFGNYNLESFDSRLSDRLILILRKK